MVYLADTSKKRRDLCTVSLWKYPQSANAHEVLNHAVSLQTLTSETKGGISHENYDTPVDSENQLFQSAFDGTPQESFNRTAEALGGESAHAQAVSDGLTELNYCQWVQVRTPEFKAWFGDWENDPENASVQSLLLSHLQGGHAWPTFPRSHKSQTYRAGILCLTGWDWILFLQKFRPSENRLCGIRPASGFQTACLFFAA